MSSLRIVEALTGVLGAPVKVRAGLSAELRWNCPFCVRVKSPDRKRHLYVNPKKGKWNCYRCSSGGKLEKLCSMLGVAADVDLSAWDDAVRMLLEGAATSEIEDEKPPEPTGMPPSVPIDPCSSAAHYLAHRGFGRSVGDAYGLRAGIGVLEHRIVIPTFSPTGEVLFWVARACSPRARGQKYINPTGSSARFFVFNLQRVIGAPECRINEGPLSGMASGLTGTCTFGKHMSKQQERAYVEARCGRYVVGYDGTARIATLNTAEKLREDGLDVWIAAFPNCEARKDPASLTFAEREAVYAAARPYSMETRLRVRAELLLCA